MSSSICTNADGVVLAPPVQAQPVLLTLCMQCRLMVLPACLTVVQVVALHPDDCKTLFPTCDKCSLASRSIFSDCTHTDNLPSLSQIISPPLLPLLLFHII